MKKYLLLIVLVFISSGAYADGSDASNSGKCKLTMQVDRSVNNAKVIFQLVNEDNHSTQFTEVDYSSKSGSFKKLPCNQHYRLYAFEIYQNYEKSYKDAERINPYGDYEYKEDPFLLVNGFSVSYPSEFQPAE